MKQPRTGDFDPHATKHKLKSSLDSMPVIEKPPTVPSIGRLTDKVPARPVAKEPARQPAPSTTPAPRAEAVKQQPNKRLIKTRCAFDIYQDQDDELKRLSYEEKMQGGSGSMSAMVREALDAYLLQRQGRGSKVS